jgi:sugar transferase (PEP-CTERM/EpsH1 system associated)
MRILMLAHRIPYPPHTGDKVRAFHVARHLAHGHDLALACLADDSSDLAGLEFLRSALGRVECARQRRAWALAKGALGMARGVPITLSYFDSPDLRTSVNRLLVEWRPDLVYVSSSSMAPYVEGRPDLRVIMDFVDVDSDKWAQYALSSRGPARWLYRLESAWLRRYEARVASWAACCLLATRTEEELLRSFAPWARTAVIANGIDLDEFAALGTAAPEPAMLFTGAMDYRPNVDAVIYFCERILPAIRREVPTASFLIVGLNPAPAVVRLGRLPGVTVAGAVPDVRPYYARAAVAVAPLRIARGIQNKVLQAMAMGVPVVATRRAAQGIEARPELDLVLEDDPDRFAARMVALLRDPAARLALGQRGRAFVETHHSWEASLGQLDRVIEAVRAEAAAGADVRFAP